MNKTIILYIGCLLLANSLLSQEDINVQDVEVVKKFKADLQETEKISIDPDLPRPDFKPRVYDYKVSTVPLEIVYPDPVIRPYAMKSDESLNAYSTYMRAGYGMLNRASADAGYNFYLEDKYNIGITMSHDQAGETIEGAERKHRASMASLTTDIFLNNRMMVTSGVSAEIGQRNLYGLGTALEGSYPLNSFDRKRNVYSANFGISSIATGSLKYKLDLQGNLVDQSDEDITEYNLSIPFTISYDLSDEVTIGWKSLVDFHDFKEDDELPWEVSPYLKLNMHPFYAKVGASVMKVNADYSYFPEAEFSYHLMDGLIRPHLGASQDYLLNSLYNVGKWNPFIEAHDKHEDHRVSKSYYGGASGTYNGIMDYRLDIGYKQIDNQLVYTINNDVRKNNIETVDLNAPFLAFHVDVDFLDKWSLATDISHHQYTTDQEGDLGVYPANTAVAMTFRYLDPNNRLYPSLGFNYLSGFRFLSQDEVLDTEDFIGAEMSVEYFVSEKVGLFIHGNNLFGGHQEVIPLNETYGMSWIGGVTARF